MMNRGCPLTEMVLEGVIRDGIGEMRNNPSRVDDLFNRFTEAHLSNQYGQAQIDKIKAYITNNQIKIVHAFSFQPTQMPCISIQMVSTQERNEDQHLGNTFGAQIDDKEQDVYATGIIPISYDTNTGKLTIDQTSDISTICPNLVFRDAVGNQFTIQPAISNQAGNKYFYIEAGANPTLNQAGEIISSIDFQVTERRMIRISEVIRLGVHAKNDVHLAKYLYYILFYILKSRDEALIRRGIHLAQGMASVFDRDDSFGGEQVFSRYIDLMCQTEFNWDQAVVQTADCFDLTIKAPAPNPDSDEEVIVSGS